jgi:hypothetical protein
MAELWTPKPARWWTLHNAGDAGGLNPAASTSYYFGQFFLFDPSTSVASQRTTLDQACRITNMRVTVVVAGTLASAGTAQFSIRKNDTTDTAGPTIAFTASGQTAAAALLVDFAAGDDFTIKFTTPAWVTLPTVTLYAVQLWWEPL